jgi:hypothetical protein
MGRFWEVDPTKALIDAYMPRFFHGKVYVERDWDGVVANDFECNSGGFLNIASKLGFLEKEEVRVTYQLEDDVRLAVYREYLKTNVDHRLVLYRFVKVMESPIWL